MNGGLFLVIVGFATLIIAFGYFFISMNKDYKFEK